MIICLCMNQNLALRLKESGIGSQVNEWFEEYESKLMGLGAILDSNRHQDSRLTNDLNRLILLSSVKRRELEDVDNLESM